MELGFCSAILPQGLSSELHNLTQINGCWKQNENWTQPADHHDTSGQSNPAIHSTTGINGINLPGFAQAPTDARVIQTTQSNPDVLPFNLDMNSGSHLGIGMHNSQRNRIFKISLIFPRLDAGNDQ